MDEEPIESSEDEEFEFEEEEIEEDFDAPAEEEGEEEDEEAPEEEVEAEAPEPEAPPPLEEEPLGSTKEIPMTISVEVGRLKLSAEKLLSLQPGNLLDLQIPAGSQVNLVVGGRPVGRGELLQIGDMVGVRILELG